MNTRLPRALVIVTNASLGLRALRGRFIFASAPHMEALNRTIEQRHLRVRPLFGVPESRHRREAALLGARGSSVPDLTRFYTATAPDGELDTLAHEFRAVEGVSASYVLPRAQLAILTNAKPADASEVTPNLRCSQGYLGHPPGGIGVETVWELPGGKGTHVRIVDIEYGWRFTHEDLISNSNGLIAGNMIDDGFLRSHGTAVAGVVGGDEANLGITGICPDAHFMSISPAGLEGSYAEAVFRATNVLREGDIILLELQIPGPRYNHEERYDQVGYVPTEWLSAMQVAIQNATERGVIVVQAAGNGQEDLDDPIYSRRPVYEGDLWNNPFAADVSASILVGAGAPPRGTHNRNHGANATRMRFSNFGRAVCSQGWGAEVTTSGFGDLHNGGNEDLWYTDRFNGTSSAAPMVVGALACIQGVLRARGERPLTPAGAKALLEATGSGPEEKVEEYIGKRPNLEEMLSELDLI